MVKNKTRHTERVGSARMVRLQERAAGTTEGGFE